jgi:hypothetical protein
VANVGDEAPDADARQRRKLRVTLPRRQQVRPVLQTRLTVQALALSRRRVRTVTSIRGRQSDPGH